VTVVTAGTSRQGSATAATVGAVGTRMPTVGKTLLSRESIVQGVANIDEHRAQHVTRLEIIDAVNTAFTGSSATKQQIVTAADQQGSREEVLTLLDRLPTRTFGHVRDLWDYLPDVPLGD
jgi:hypothetical protein